MWAAAGAPVLPFLGTKWAAPSQNRDYSEEQSGSKEWLLIHSALNASIGYSCCPHLVLGANLGSASPSPIPGPQALLPSFSTLKIELFGLCLFIPILDWNYKGGQVDMAIKTWGLGTWLGLARIEGQCISIHSCNRKSLIRKIFQVKTSKIFSWKRHVSPGRNSVKLGLTHKVLNDLNVHSITQGR